MLRIQQPHRSIRDQCDTDHIIYDGIDKPYSIRIRRMPTLDREGTDMVMILELLTTVRQ